MVLRQKGSTRCDLHRMSFLSLIVTPCRNKGSSHNGHAFPDSCAGCRRCRRTVGTSCHTDETVYVKLGDGVTAALPTAVRRSTRIASTALRVAVSSKRAQMARSHEPRSGQPSNIQYH